MPLPPLDPTLHVLPPHRGSPTNHEELSPYPATMLDVCTHFASSPERREIVRGLLNLRHLLRHAGIHGFQWLDGSFVENIEALENRPPRDIDVVTFCFGVPETVPPILAQPAQVMEQYRVDHYFVDAAYRPDITVEQTRYWTGLFSHSRSRISYPYGVWKGMVRVELNGDATDDENAIAWLSKQAEESGK